MQKTTWLHSNIKAFGVCKISENKECFLPKCEFVDSNLRRRLSPLSKIAVALAHNTKCKTEKYINNCFLVMTSLTGEIATQIKINKQIVNDKEIRPQSFSLSVFNAAAANVTKSLNLHEGYEVIFPSINSTANIPTIEQKGLYWTLIANALQTAWVKVACGSYEQVLFIYANEKIPDMYSGFNAFTSYKIGENDVLNATSNFFQGFSCLLSKDLKNEKGMGLEYFIDICAY